MPTRQHVHTLTYDHLNFGKQKQQQNTHLEWEVRRNSTVPVKGLLLHSFVAQVLKVFASFLYRHYSNVRLRGNKEDNKLCKKKAAENRYVIEYSTPTTRLQQGNRRNKKKKTSTNMPTVRETENQSRVTPG